MNYKTLIPRLKIVNKEGQIVPFILNAQQSRFLDEMTNKDIILKARQIGFSSLILAVFTWDFLLKENSRSVCISHDASSAQKLLDRVRFYLKSLEDQGVAMHFSVKNRNELINADKNSSFYIHYAGSDTSLRGDTITNLHLSEFAFYPNPESLLASSLQAVVPTGRVVIESTANGMANYLKTYWDKAKAKQNNFTPHFFDNSFYSPEFLAEKRLESGEELFKQEYPSNDLEAFLSSGDLFFDKEALKYYLDNVKEPIATYQSHYDLP